MASFRTRALVVGGLCVVALLGSGLGGCATRRSLPVVQADAERAFSLRQWDKAANDYAEYVQRKPDANDMRFMLAQSQLAGGRPREALEHLIIALDVDPLNEDILAAHAEALYASGEREALTAFLNRAASERGRVQDYLRMATYQQKLGHPDEAQTALLTAAKLDDGRSFSVQKSFADFYKSYGDRRRYVQRLRMAYFLQPDNAELVKEIREAGEIPGPTFALAPTEMREAVAMPVEAR
jgi:tetratricopeptide (TPR) repeat protein